MTSSDDDGDDDTVGVAEVVFPGGDGVVDGKGGDDGDDGNDDSVGLAEVFRGGDGVVWAKDESLLLLTSFTDNGDVVIEVDTSKDGVTLEVGVVVVTEDDN